ncbi:hypothetical protein EIQ06_15040 [Xanthomonas campestris pv. campestris]
MDTSESTIFHGLEMSRKPWAYQTQRTLRFSNFPKTPSSVCTGTLTPTPLPEGRGARAEHTS